ncbi:MAG: alpha-rhamnosidase, partial [bacterium]
MKRITILLLAFITTSALGAPAPTPVDLRCEYLANPLGIDSLNPRLSWVITSDQRSEIQSAYQVLVASSEDALTKDAGDLWDSGKVASDQSILVPYAGKELGS